MLLCSTKVCYVRTKWMQNDYSFIHLFRRNKNEMIDRKKERENHLIMYSVKL